MELPAGWAWSRLEEVAEVRLGRQRSPKNHSGDQMRPYLRAANVDWNGLKLGDVKEMNFTDAELETYRLIPGDIVLSEASGSAGEVGKPAIWNDQIADCCFQNTLIRVRATTNIEPHYLLHLLRHEATRGAFAKGARGVGIHHLGAAKLAAWRIPVPPLAEQRRIVESLESHLSRLDAGSAYLTVVQAKSRRLRSLLYGRAMSGGFSRPVNADETPTESALHLASRSLATRRWQPITPVSIPGYTLPDNWTNISLGTLSHSSGYGTSTKCGYDALGYPVLRIPNVQGGSIDLSDVKNAVDPELDLTKFSLDPGDLLFVRTNGSPSLIGRVGVVEKPLAYAFASYLIRFRLTPGFVEPRWIQLVTQSPLWRRAIERYAASSAGQYNLSAETLSRLPIPVPPLEVQRETLAAVDTAVVGAVRLVSATDAAIRRSRHLRISVANRAFSGQLVPQDPADEPASLLLERIRAEREAQGGKAMRGTRRPRKTDEAAPPPPPASTPSPATAVQQELPL
ncbi:MULTISPECIES: restriction endonuclease subunit S [unclassified Streptomyces]|uniref:restriction endonuclease subunit S n=1 Tax=unclassified Streptomyces TaxID=2593676 RepID=UPI0027E54FA3|nr:MULTISPECIES: restriction endonuclease subunit S [unclassified Streptomyces]